MVQSIHFLAIISIMICNAFSIRINENYSPSQTSSLHEICHGLPNALEYRICLISHGQVVFAGIPMLSPVYMPKNHPIEIDFHLFYFYYCCEIFLSSFRIVLRINASLIFSYPRQPSSFCEKDITKMMQSVIKDFADNF